MIWNALDISIGTNYSVNISSVRHYHYPPRPSKYTLPRSLATEGSFRGDHASATHRVFTLKAPTTQQTLGVLHVVAEQSLRFDSSAGEDVDNSATTHEARRDAKANDCQLGKSRENIPRTVSCDGPH